MAFITPEQAAAEAARKEELRQRGVAQAKQLAEASGQTAVDLQARQAAAKEALAKSARVGTRSIAAGQAEALAAGTAAGAGGGSQYGALLQAGQTAGMKGAQFQADLALQGTQQDLQFGKEIGEAKKAAAAQSLEATKLEAEAGSGTADKQKKIADYRSQAETAMQNSKGFFNDDEALAAKRIRALVENEEDPDVRKAIEDLARQVEDGSYDF